MGLRVFVWSTISFHILRTCFSASGGAPKIQPFHFPSNVKIGEKASVICLVATAVTKIRWLRNGVELSSSSNIRIKYDSDFSTIVLDPVDANSTGNYTCEATNSAGKDSYSTSLQVKGPPQWVQEPTDAVLRLGDSLVVNCKASGFPVPVIKWERVKDGDREAVLREVFQVTEASLAISQAKVDHEGEFICTADNGIEPSIERAFKITVIVPARFEEKYETVNAKKGDSARMKCEALGDQPLAVTWRRDGTTISKSGDDRYEIFETLTAKGVASELIIRTTDRDDGALYMCLAENEFGSDERSIRLLVMEVPAPPLDVKIREKWSRSASVSWAPPFSGNSPITKYIVQYWRDIGGSPHRLLEISAPSSQSSAIMKDLHPGTAYVLKVVAENAVGRGEPSDAVFFKTGEEEPSSPPADIIAEPRGSSTIRVSWKPPPKESWNGDLKGYFVGYKSRDSTQPYSYKTMDYVPDVEQEFFLTNLLKASDYSVVVKAFNAAGSGPPSHELFVRTLDGDLPPAPSLYVLATSPTSVSLRWNTRKIDNPLSGYTVHYREDQGHWQEVAVIAPEDNTYTLSNLHPDKTYQIYVTATNQYGKGDPSEIVAVKTDEREGQSLLSSAALGPNGYAEMAVVVPVAASLLTILVVLIIACVCVRKIRSRHNLERALAAEKHLAMVGTLQRYVDIDKTRSLMDASRAGHYPLPYETIQMVGDEHDPAVRAAFVSKDGTLYNKPMTLPREPREQEENIYDNPQ